jgi:2-polyprenyl-3-methyl-5-hydroxy-6-metoxy-1,4-benzoquinol methylase
MRAEISARLRAINREFYQSFAESFAATRSRLQPGVQRVIENIPQNARVLDLGCGHGLLASRLAELGHHGTYVGVDASPRLIELAREDCLHPAAIFILGDLLERAWHQALEGQFDRVFAFALLHHIPGTQARVDLARTIYKLLAPDGNFAHSNWNFAASARLRARIVPWEKVGLAAADVEANDYLLDWRRDGHAYRYVHLFNQDRLLRLAEQSGFIMHDGFYSDGEGGELGLYQIWVKPGVLRPEKPAL